MRPITTTLFLFLITCGPTPGTSASGSTASDDGSSSSSESSTTSTSTTDDSTTSTTDNTSTGATSTLTGGAIRVCKTGICNDLADWCAGTGLGEDACAQLGLLCPGSPCAACDLAADTCAGDCEDVATACAGVDACDCGYSCDEPANALSLDKLFALCIEHPWALGEDCEEPSAGACMAVMQTDCAPTACEYIECIKALEQDPCTMPSGCRDIALCGSLA